MPTTVVTNANHSRFAGLVPIRLLPHLRSYLPSLRAGERNRAERRRIQRWLLRMHRQRGVRFARLGA
jgi:hypothetical protein